MKKKAISIFLAVLMAGCTMAGSFPVNVFAESDNDFVARMEEMFDGSSDSAVESVGARWWMSGGLHTNETIKESIEELASYGIKEVELVTLNESNVDASTYGCFSPEWWEDCEYAIREATKHGMAISLTSGAN